MLPLKYLEMLKIVTKTKLSITTPMYRKGRPMAYIYIENFFNLTIFIQESGI